jgi:hypothetical protein
MPYGTTHKNCIFVAQQFMPYGANSLIFVELCKYVGRHLPCKAVVEDGEDDEDGVHGGEANEQLGSIL